MRAALNALVRPVMLAIALLLPSPWAAADMPEWRAWHAALLHRVSETPRDAMRDALIRLQGSESRRWGRAELEAVIELSMAAQVQSRDAQKDARDWLEAATMQVRAQGLQPRDLAIELMALHAMDDALLGRRATAERLLDEAGQLLPTLQDPAQAWTYFYAKGVLALVRGDGAQATRHFDEALDRSTHDMHRGLMLTWKALALRRLANPVRNMVQTSLGLLDEADRLLPQAPASSLRLFERYTRLQTIVLLGDFTQAHALNLQIGKITEALSSQGYLHAEALIGVIPAQFRREEATLAERLQFERIVLLWSVGIIGSLSCVALTVMALRVRQRRRLRVVSSQLQTSNSELQDLARTRARLLAAACHDLRQPAHALGLSAELAMLAGARSGGPQDQEEVRLRLRDIRRNSITLTDMLGELMDQTRLAGGSYEPDVGPLALGELLDEVRLQFSDVARRKGLAFVVEDTAASVISDRHLLRRICFNVVSNAVKYTQRGQVTVKAVDVAPHHVRLIVQDTGPGIDAQELPQVFGDYVRLEAGKAQEGLGIGLSVVKRAAELLGHPLEFQSTPDAGTTVTVLLERGQAETAPQAPDGATGLPGRGQTVAVLEDDAESRQALTALLRQWGFEVVTAVSAADLAECLKPRGNTPPDLLLTDLHLGMLDGLEQAQIIRAWPGFERLPTLLITGDLAPENTSRAQALGIPVGHKPIIPRRLLALVQGMLAAEARETDSS
jgi:signal transduction histidine kinase